MCVSPLTASLGIALIRIIIIVLTSMALVACSDANSHTPNASAVESPIPTSVQAYTPTPSADVESVEAGTVIGKVTGYKQEWRGREIVVYACPFYSTEGKGGGFYVLESSIHPSGIVSSSGEFRILGVSSGQYAIVAGPAPEEAVALRERGQVRIVTVVAGQITDLGQVEFE